MIGKTKRRVKKTGMIDKLTTIKGMYQTQIEFQKEVQSKIGYDFSVKDLPEDNVQGFSYHIQQLMSEIGEVLSADKRWKNYRNEKLDSENKKEEIADCFIVLMNIAIFSGITPEEFEESIVNKMAENAQRLQSLKKPVICWEGFCLPCFYFKERKNE